MSCDLGAQLLGQVALGEATVDHLEVSWRENPLTDHIKSAMDYEFHVRTFQVVKVKA